MIGGTGTLENPEECGHGYSDGPAPTEHESVRLQHVKQQQTASDAETNRAEARARQEKYAREQQQVIPSLT